MFSRSGGGPVLVTPGRIKPPGNSRLSRLGPAFAGLAVFGRREKITRATRFYKPPIFISFFYSESKKPTDLNPCFLGKGSSLFFRGRKNRTRTNGTLIAFTGGAKRLVFDGRAGWKPCRSGGRPGPAGWTAKDQRVCARAMDFFLFFLNLVRVSH